MIKHERDTGKGNIEKLAMITSGLTKLSLRYDELIEEIVEKLEEIDSLNSSINSLMLNNELVGAKKISEFDTKTRNSFKTLINDDSAEILRSLLEDARLNLDDLIIYYKQHYLQTVAKQEEALKRK